MSVYSEIQKEKRNAADKSCPKCHRLMKSAVVNGSDVWICLYCGTKVTEAAE